MNGFSSVDEFMIVSRIGDLMGSCEMFFSSPRTKLRPGTSPVPWSCVMLSHGVLSRFVGCQKVGLLKIKVVIVFGAENQGRLHFSRK